MTLLTFCHIAVRYDTIMFSNILARCYS